MSNRYLSFGDCVRFCSRPHSHNHCCRRGQSRRAGGTEDHTDHPHSSAGAEIMTAWNTEIEKSRKPADDQPRKTEATSAPRRTVDNKDVTFDVLACDADKLFGSLLNNQQDSGACQLTASPRAEILLNQELWDSSAAS